MTYRGGKYVFEEIGEDGSFTGDASLVDGSIKSSVPFGRANLDSSSFEAPSIDSDFLASMRSSLFGDNSSQGQDEEKKEDKSRKFTNTGMFSVTSSDMQDSISTYVSKASDDSDSILESEATVTTVSMSKDSAASYLVNKAVDDRRGSVSFNFTRAGRPPLPATGMPIVPAAGGPNNKPKKIYAREEGEWRKDRSWISQRALDRTARKIAEEAARQLQIKRQEDEDEFIGLRLATKEDHMENYFKKDDGVAMIQAVVDELRDLRKDEIARQTEEVRSCAMALIGLLLGGCADTSIRYVSVSNFEAVPNISKIQHFMPLAALVAASCHQKEGSGRGNRQVSGGEAQGRDEEGI